MFCDCLTTYEAVSIDVYFIPRANIITKFQSKIIITRFPCISRVFSIFFKELAWFKLNLASCYLKRRCLQT